MGQQLTPYRLHQYYTTVRMNSPFKQQNMRRSCTDSNVTNCQFKQVAKLKTSESPILNRSRSGQKSSPHCPLANDVSLVVAASRPSNQGYVA